jgi:hypothetical protein
LTALRQWFIMKLHRKRRPTMYKPFEAFQVNGRLISVIGSGGKTTLLRHLSERLSGTVILTTSTHMYPFPGMPLVDAGGEASPENRRRVLEALRSALKHCRVVCLGRPQSSGKLADPSAAIPFEALADAAARGATSCVGFDLNYKAGGKYVLLGFKRTNDPESAIRDIYLTVGKEAQKMVDVDGYAYTCVGPVSLNVGTGGLSVYMYVTNGVKYVEATPDETEEYEDEEDEEDEDDNPFSRMSREEESKTKLEYMDLSPINQIVAMPRDFLPTPGKMGYVWEHLLTDEGSLCNVNEGAFSINEEDMSLADARLYLFARRRDNTVKPGARITEVDGRIMMGVGTIQYTSNGKLGSSSNTQSGNANRVDGPADGDWGGSISAPDPEYKPPAARRPYLP